jgi:hypothetical protein
MSNNMVLNIQTTKNTKISEVIDILLWPVKSHDSDHQSIATWRTSEICFESKSENSERKSNCC